jgi:hypothetical protein
MEDAMREQQEKFREDLRQQQMAFLKEQSEYMAAYNAQAQQAMNVSVLFLLYMLRHLHLRCFNLVKTCRLYQPNFKSLLNLIL